MFALGVLRGTSDTDYAFSFRVYVWQTHQAGGWSQNIGPTINSYSETILLWIWTQSHNGKLS